MKISICIPTWEQYGKGIEFLKSNFDSLLFQTYKNFNVIISDHSKDDNIKLLCDEYSTHFEIKYFKNNEFFGNGPANTNNSIINADGDIVKIIFQDDFLYQKNALELIFKKFQNNECNWLVTGCNHTYDHGKTFVDFMIPRWNNSIKEGINTISSPSVLSFRNNEPCLFDINLTMLMDCDMYQQLYVRYGLPTILPDCLVTNRMHKHQISNLYNQNIQEEINYINNKNYNNIKYKN
jgi:glycosyltransferase involved in cell wall biosynthesis